MADKDDELEVSPIEDDSSLDVEPMELDNMSGSLDVDDFEDDIEDDLSDGFGGFDDDDDDGSYF